MKSFRFFQLSFVILVVGCCLTVDAKPDGAPEAACDTMTPQHGVDWQQTACPFEITVNKTTIYPGQSLNIHLGIKEGVDVNEPAAKGFKGFMIMVKDASGVSVEPLGIFGDPATNEAKTMDCPDSARGPNFKKPKVGATHTNNGYKKSVDVVWTPAENFIGDVIVLATFVHEKDISWVKENSRSVAVRPDPGETPTVPTTTTTTPSTTTTTTTETPTTSTTKATTTTTTAPAAAGQLSVAKWTTLFSVAVTSFFIFNRF